MHRSNEDTSAVVREPKVHKCHYCVDKGADLTRYALQVPVFGKSQTIYVCSRGGAVGDKGGIRQFGCYLKAQADGYA